jgi:hypothetical protein
MTGSGSAGAASEPVIDALKAAKPEIVALLTRYSLTQSGALQGDDLTAELTQLGFCVRRYGSEAALDDDAGRARVPPMPLLYRFAERQAEYGLALRVLRAPDALPGMGVQRVAS